MSEAAPCSKEVAVLTFEKSYATSVEPGGHIDRGCSEVVDIQAEETGVDQACMSCFEFEGINKQDFGEASLVDHTDEDN